MIDRLKPLSWLGIGSVPFEESVNSCRATFESWDLPFWPQYPARSLRENFVFQFLSFFPGLEVTEEKARFDETEYLCQAREYRRRLREVFSEKSFLSFEPPSEWALGYSQMKILFEEAAFPEKRVIKLQVTGPGTVWNSFFLGQVFRQAPKIRRDLLHSLTAAGLAQIERVSSSGRTAVILIDEPIRAANLSGLKAMIDAFRKRGAWVGLHVCSSAAWEGFERLGIHLFHFDLTTHPELSFPHRRFLQNFLKRKNWVAWGVVSTTRGQDTGVRDCSDFFLDYLKEVSDEELTLEEIARRSLIAPACGTGTLTPAQEVAVRESLRVTQESLKKKLGVHLPRTFPKVRGLPSLCI